jgi:hypothetical protein
MAQRARRGRRGRRAWRAPAVPRAAWALLALAAAGGVNWAYQVVRKPTELLSLVAPSLAKTPDATWSEYGGLFDAHSTAIVRPELLAALAQVESAGDPLASTYWRWRPSWNPLEVYAPASSAVGLLQITDGTFDEARRLCIHDHQVAREGAWHDPRACWFNGLYFRTVPGHAIEMTSAMLHQAVVDTLVEQRATRATLEQKQRLAAVIHLCGRSRGAAFVQRGFRPSSGERCGDHEVARYLARVEVLTRLFARKAR